MRSESSTNILQTSRNREVAVVLCALASLLLLNLLLQRYFQPVWVWAHGGPPRTPNLSRIILRDTLKFWIGSIGFPFATVAVTAFVAINRRFSPMGTLRSGLVSVALIALYFQLAWEPKWTHDTRAAVHEQVLRTLHMAYRTAIEVLPVMIAIFLLLFAVSVHSYTRRR